MINIKKIIKIILAGFLILVILSIIGAVIGEGGNKSTSVKEAFNSGMEKGREVVNGNFKDQEVTESTVKTALSKLEDSSYRVTGEGNITKIEVLDNAGTEDNPNDYIVHVYFRPKTVWDEKDSLKMTAGTAVAVMMRLFPNPKVTNVVVWMEGDFTDNYGKSESATLARVGITKTTADKIEWEKFRDLVLVDYNKLFDIADIKYIHPAVQKAIK